MTGPLAVLGAINVDLVVSGAALPSPGETVVGGAFEQHQGGKGGNQAVAAARALGDAGRVVMLGAVGDDGFGRSALDALDREHVDVSRVRTVGEATGVALISVDPRGENQISVAPGANHEVGDDVTDLDELRPSLVLASCEVPYAAVSAALTWCREHQVPFILNPAPASLRLRNLILNSTAITPNRGEILDFAPGVSDPVGAARALRKRSPALAVVITLGEDGAFVADEQGETIVDAPQVEAVDTTGAGDCFNGVLAASLWEGLPFREAVRRAVTAAALSVTVAGAREGMPTRARLDDELG